MKLEEIIKIVEDLGSDSIDVFGGKWLGGKCIQQIPDEISPCILELINIQQYQKIKFKNWLEIGAAAGGTTFLFNYFFKFEDVIIIDDNCHEKWNLRSDILKEINVKEFIGNSHSPEAIQYIKNLNLTFDIMFIDGDHSYSGVKQDTENFIPFLKGGGFVIYHDAILCDGPRAVTAELQTNINFKHIQTYISKIHSRPLGVSCFQKL